MKINVLTLFPKFFEGPLSTSIINRAITNNFLNVNLVNFRDFANDKHKRVDDTPYGGGAGMVLKVDVIDKCLSSLESKGHVVALSPTGKLLSEDMVVSLLKHDNLTLLCGHYEGFDERVYNYVDEVISIGDYILSGGESASVVLIDALARKLDGVIKKDSVENDSFVNGILDYPTYTKPLVYNNQKVPDVLLSGDHERISRYRYKEAIRKTYINRFDLIEKNYEMIDENLFREVKKEEENGCK